MLMASFSIEITENYKQKWFSSETKTRVISKLSEKLQNCLETDYVICKVQ